jgi:hypothetical protein
MRDEASDLLEIEGEAVEVTGDGTEVVCNVNAKLAIAQPRITKDFLNRVIDIPGCASARRGFL